jgi:integrase
MGTIQKRKLTNGHFAYKAQIIRKESGKVTFRKSRQFEREVTARAWMKRIEKELDTGQVKTEDKIISLSDAIDLYLEKSNKEIGKTKAQVLRSIKSYAIASLDCKSIQSQDLVAFATELKDGGREASTVGNYMSHLSAIFNIAKPAWGIPLNPAEMKEAMTVTAHLGTTGKSKKRDRRPTLEELDRILTHFEDRSLRQPRCCPMHKIVVFALFSTRRQDEICRITWEDLESENSRALVRDMKNPGQKMGNDVWCELVPEAMKVIESMPQRKGRVFPYHPDTVSAAFTRACKFLEIENLRFHDLRHEGISRLIEMGRTQPQAASVSGHKSWSSLQRYSHLVANGDKYENWNWLDRVCKPS